MDENITQKLSDITAQLKKVEESRSQLVALGESFKNDLFGRAGTQPRAVWVQLQLKSGVSVPGRALNDYELTFKTDMGTAADGRWKLDVNEKYQKAVGTVISLSTATLGSPFLFLKDIHNTSILNVLTLSARVGACCLALSIVSAVVYYFMSAKWAKLALVGKADIFWIKANEGFVESTLDLSYLLMTLGFLAGVSFMFYFLVTHTLP